jgi:uncharacterized protein
MLDGGEIRNNEGRSRFELLVDGAIAVAQYKLDGEVIHFTHTIVPREVEGRGIGSRLVKGALDEARRRGLKVDPVCPFVRTYIERHAEYRDLLAA